MRALVRVLVCVLAAGLVAPGPAVAQAAGPEEGRALLERAEEAFFDESLPNAAVRQILERSLSAFAKLADPCVRAYWQGRVQYLYGFVEQADNQPEAAEGRFQRSLQLAESALRCGESSEVYRVMADAQAQLLVLNNLAYKMTHGQKAKQWVMRAVELDPGNVAAQLSLALYYKNAPRFAGGDEEQARRILHELEARGDLAKGERFSVNTWLGIAYSERKERDKARAYLVRAQAVYPGNTWLRELLAEL